VVSKSKFTSDTTSAALDMDDPLFWQKVMPDFVTPQIMTQQLQDLSDEIFGTTTKKRGRGRGRWKRKQAEEKKDELAEEKPEEPAEPEEAGEAKDDIYKLGEEATSNADADGENNDNHQKEATDDVENDGNEVGEDDEEEEEEKKFQLTKTHKRKIAKFMSDLKSMMESLLDDAEDDNLPDDDKAVAQKLLLTISVKDKIFNEEQRHFARSMQKRLEGNRRRRCRTTDQSERFSPTRKSRGQDPSEIREELRIVSKKIKKRRKAKGGRDDDEEEGQERKRRRKRSGSPEIGEDGYKVHSDDEADWSDVAEDIYGPSSKKKATISRKEVNRRRQWGAGDDAATAAGRAWPALPRTEVSKVLGTLIDEVLKHDEARGGIFSVPVPRDEFPQYYEMISSPMDYGTMKKKLENGEYRSAQAMQKDFVLVMQNCLSFNAADSEIVQEARQQALMRPTLLRAAAAKHDLFLAEDGSVFYIIDNQRGKGDSSGASRPKKRGKRSQDDPGEDVDSEEIKPKKKRGKKRPAMELGVEDDDVPLESMRRKKPRIKINLREAEEADEESLGEVEAAAEIIENQREDAAEPPVGRQRRARKSTSAATPEAEKQQSRTPSKKGKKRAAAKSNEDIVEPAGEPKPELASSPRSRRRSARANGKVVKQYNDSEFLDVPLLKKEREELGKNVSFAEARQLFTKRSPWVLPEPLDSSKFQEVALATLKKVEKIDRYSLFAEPVSDDDAPDYSKIVKKPIDLSTMKTKLEKGKYKSAAYFSSDLLLMFDNCKLYNDDEDGGNDVLDEAARIFALVPELYGEACLSVLKKQNKEK